MGRFAIDKKIQVGMREIIIDVGKGDIDKIQVGRAKISMEV